MQNTEGSELKVEEIENNALRDGAMALLMQRRAGKRL
jgi:hypothetical protein